MKHIKLFENFDRYDFKRYDCEYYDMVEVYDSMEIEKLSIDDFSMIMNAIPDVSADASYIQDKKNDGFKDYCRITTKDKIQYIIYYLGDYTYALLKYDLQAFKCIFIEVFDELESLLNELIKENENETH